MPHYHVTVSARRLHWPQQCPCCGGAADTRSDIRYVRPDHKGRASCWEVPFCSHCVQHSQKKRSWLVLISFLAICGVASLVVGCAPEAHLLWAIGLATLVACAALSARMRVAVDRLRRPSCTCDSSPVKYMDRYGTQHSFQFASEVYARAFEAANRDKVVRGVTVTE
jgi:hypothetical protein